MYVRVRPKARKCPRKLRGGYFYSVVPESAFCPDLGKYRTYGIRYMCSGQEIILHDASVDLKTVRNIVDIINQHGVSPIHLLEIVGDLLP